MGFDISGPMLGVARVRQALRGQNLWLLVVNRDGSNVWGAAAGGILTEHRVITFQDRDACFNRGGCVKQCPEDALNLVPAAWSTSTPATW